MLKRKALMAAVTGTVGFGIAFGAIGVGVASASPPTFPDQPSYGFDGNAHLIVGGGSTTVFRLAQSLAALWEDSAGCNTNNSKYNAASGGETGATPYPQANGSEAFNQCTGITNTNGTGGQTYASSSAGGNFDGDTVAIATPAGSSTGIASLNGDDGGTAGTYAYLGTNENLETSGDPNALNVGGSGTDVSNGYGTVDFDLSSRAPKTTKGNCNTDSSGNADELVCDTFWGVASDGVGIYTFDSNAGLYQGSASTAFSGQDLFDIFNCTVTTWGQLPEWQALDAESPPPAGLPASTAPIVPWAMNSSSGTFGDFNSWIANNATGVPSGWTMDNGCERDLSTSGAAPLSLPLENDFKPLIVEAGTSGYNPALYTWPTGSGDEGMPPVYNGVNNTTTFPAGVTTSSATSPQNPNNWIWFGSFGLLSTFTYLSNATSLSTPSGAVTFTSQPNAVSGTPVGGSGTQTDVLPSQGSIQGNTYPIGRVLNIVTKKSDADCPVSASDICDFNPADSGSTAVAPTNGNGQADFDVNGASSGKGGAIREFMRWMCRPGTGSAASGTNIAPLDPYTGVSMSASSATGNNGEINTIAVENNGFRPVPLSKRSPGSTCDVISYTAG